MVSRVAEPEVGPGSAAVTLSGLGLPGAKLTGTESLALASLDLGTAGCFALAGSVADSVAGTRLTPLTGDCSVGTGVVVGAGVGVDVGVGAGAVVVVGVGVGVGVGVAGAGADDVSGKMSEAGWVGGAGFALRADGGRGWSEELLGTDDGAACVSGVAGVSGAGVGVNDAGVNGAAATDGDWTVGD